MALTAGTHFEIRSNATAGNLNGAGFNPASAAFPTDLTTDADTANTASPVVSSATYNFAASDVGAWIYVAAGTNFIVGWYQIASVASNKATLSAAIGAGVVYTAASNSYAPSTAVGIATVGTPTGGTFGIDYSQQTTAQFTATNLTTSGAGATTVTSATTNFTRMMVGNLIHITAGTNFQTGWYEIITFTDSGNVVLDRTPSSGGAGASGTFYVGGAGTLDALADPFFEMIPAGSSVWIKSGTHTLSAPITVSSTNSTTANPSNIMGYTSLRGDPCNGSSRPLLACGASGSTFGVAINIHNMSVTTTSLSGLALGTSSIAKNCKVVNSSTTASRTAITLNTNGSAIDCEAVSLNGTGIGSGQASARILGCYIHDSNIGVSTSSSNTVVLGCLLEGNKTTALSIGSVNNVIGNNTIYGSQAKVGVGLDLITNPATNNNIFGNIFYGLETAINVAAEFKTNNSWANNFFNNTTDQTLFTKSKDSLALNPGFIGATQITGTTATTSGSVLTQAGGDFSSVTDNVDVLHVVSGTGVTVGQYLITGHTGTTLTTNNALGTSAAGDVVYWITTGHNFAIGTALKALGFPLFGGALETTGYADIGAVQRQESSGGGCFTFS